MMIYKLCVINFFLKKKKLKLVPQIQYNILTIRNKNFYLKKIRISFLFFSNNQSSI